jgi:hypothetical protein
MQNKDLLHRHDMRDDNDMMLSSKQVREYRLGVTHVIRMQYNLFY